MSNTMIDIETLGQDKDAMILSIGAVIFDSNGLGDEFYRNISIPSNKGRTITLETIEWWFKQDDKAIKALVAEGSVSLEQALTDLNEFIRAHKAGKVWAHGVSFDLGILRDAFISITGHRPAWVHRNEFCMRSIRVIGKQIGFDYKAFKKKNMGTAHNALDDAVCQAKYVSEILRRVK